MLTLEEIEEGERLLAAKAKPSSMFEEAMRWREWIDANAPALLASAKAAAWRPISEAPRDGTWFQAWWPGRNPEDNILMTRWDNEWISAEEGPCFMDRNEERLDGTKPTHWRPIGPLPDARREALDALLADDGELYGDD